MLKLILTLALAYCSGCSHTTPPTKELTHQKLQLVIPKIRFNDLPLKDALESLNQESRRLSGGVSGVQFFMEVEEPMPTSTIEEDPLALAIQPIKHLNILINLHGDDMRIVDALRNICQQSGLSYEVRATGVAILEDILISQFETRFYAVPTALIDIIKKKYQNKSDSQAFKNYFEVLGINFPPSAKLKYVATPRRLVVTNSYINHLRLSEIFKQLDIESPEVSIE